MPSFEYFCGANVHLYINGMPTLEAAGLSYSIRESRRPIFGYSSRLYDALGRGQVIVEGTLLINYVHQDYLYTALNYNARTDKFNELTPNAPIQSLFNEPDYTDIKRYLEEELLLLSGEDSKLKNKVQDLLGTVASRANQQSNLAQVASNSVSLEQSSYYDVHGMLPTYNPHDMNQVTIRAIFGDPLNPRSTGFALTGLAFTGRGQQIQIDHEVIVEAYSFIARNVWSIKPPNSFISVEYENKIESE